MHWTKYAKTKWAPPKFGSTNMQYSLLHNICCVTNIQYLCVCSISCVLNCGFMELVVCGYKSIINQNQNEGICSSRQYLFIVIHDCDLDWFKWCIPVKTQSQKTNRVITRSKSTTYCLNVKKKSWNIVAKMLFTHNKVWLKIILLVQFFCIILLC